MSENTYTLLIVVVLLLTMGYVLYLDYVADQEETVFQRIHRTLLYGWMKLQVGIGYGIIALQSQGKAEYRQGALQVETENPRVKQLRQKEVRMAELKEQNRASGNRKKGSGRLKILK